MQIFKENKNTLKLNNRKCTFSYLLSSALLFRIIETLIIGYNLQFILNKKLGSPIENE